MNDKNIDIEFFKSLLEALPDMIHVNDHLGNIVYVNSQYSLFFGFGADEVIGKNRSFIDSLIEKNSDIINRDKAVLENSKDMVVIEERVKLKSGKEAWFETTKRSFEYKGKKYTIYSSEDINRRKSHQESSKRWQVDMSKLNTILKDRVSKELEKNRDKDHILIQQSKLAAMGEMIGNIAHQWRQPLNTLSLLFAKIDRYFDRGKLDRDELDKIGKNASTLISQMSDTIDDFKNFYVPNKKREKFDVVNMVDWALKLVESAIASNNIEVIREYSGNFYTYGFPNEFSQAILNLISNAKDSIVSSGKFDRFIKIKIYEFNQKIIIEIKDSGVGIPEDIVDKIFEPYFTTKEKSNGTGIGLYMSKKIIEDNMGGKIAAKNESEGATFVITMDSYNT